MTDDFTDMNSPLHIVPFPLKLEGQENVIPLAECYHLFFATTYKNTSNISKDFLGLI